MCWVTFNKNVIQHLLSDAVVVYEKFEGKFSWEESLKRKEQT